MIEYFEINGYYLYNYHCLNVIGIPSAYIYKPKSSNKRRHEKFLCSKNFKLEDFINNKEKHLTISI